MGSARRLRENLRFYRPLDPPCERHLDGDRLKFFEPALCRQMFVERRETSGATQFLKIADVRLRCALSPRRYIVPPQGAQSADRDGLPAVQYVRGSFEVRDAMAAPTDAIEQSKMGDGIFFPFGS
jgi:hypothetical protein